MLSLQDSLRSSTQEGRIVPGWPMRLGETLLQWKSKDKKCCLYETPYIAAPIWLRPMGGFLQTHLQEPDFFFWFTSEAFLKRPVLSYWDSYVKLLWGGLQAKVVPERTLIPLLEESHKEYLQVSLQADSALMRHHEQNAYKTLKIKMTTRKGGWEISPDSCVSHPLRF